MIFLLLKGLLKNELRMLQFCLLVYLSMVWGAVKRDLIIYCWVDNKIFIGVAH